MGLRPNASSTTPTAADAEGHADDEQEEQCYSGHQPDLCPRQGRVSQRTSGMQGVGAVLPCVPLPAPSVQIRMLEYLLILKLILKLYKRLSPT